MIEKVILLSHEEYKKYESIIPKTKEPWWLYCEGLIPCCARGVGNDGLVYSFNVSEVLGIRPAIVGKLPAPFKPGDKAEFYGYFWTVLDYNLVLCDSIIHEASFSGTNNKWETSFVCNWLKEWSKKLPMSTTIYHHPQKTKLEHERAIKLVRSFIDFEINDCSELDYALEELREIGLTDDELKMLGYDVFFKDEEKEEENDENWGVHISHCCKWHGCKYGDPDCPVKLGKVKQAYLCEYCSEDLEEEKFFVEKLAEIAEMKKFRGD